MHDKIKIDPVTGLMVDVVSPDKIGENIIETPCPDGFYIQKWDGTQWVEGKTAEEIAAIKTSAVVEKTPEQRISELETLVLQNMGVI